MEIDFYMNGKLTQSNGHYDRNVVDFDKIDFTRRKHYRIVIDCDGDTTRAIMTVDGKEIKGAVARRNPEDKFNWRKGAALAFERLWNSPKKAERKAEKKPEVRAVKRYANPGEYIKIVYAESANDENYHDGDILLVTKYYEGKRCHRVLHVMQRYIVDCFTSADAVQAVYKRMGLKLDFGDPMNWIELEDNE